PAAGVQLAAQGVGRIAVVGVRELLHLAADELGFRVAEDLAQAAVHAQEDAVEADMRHARAGELEALPEQRFALPQPGLGLLAPQELAEQAADQLDRVLQAAVGLADAVVPHRDHARDRALREHREHERAAQPGLLREHLLHARVARGVRYPERAAALPDRADQSRAALERQAARALAQRFESRLMVAGRLVVAQHPGRLVQAEEAAALPAFGLADCLQHGAHALGRARRYGQRARRLVLEAQRVLGGDAGRHVLGDPAIAGERPDGVEHRPAGDADVAHLAVLGLAAQQQVVERLARVEHAPMRVPRRADDLGARQLPAAQADVGLRRNAAARVARPGGADEPHFGVLLPVPVGRELGERAEARLALAQRGL